MRKVDRPMKKDWNSSERDAPHRMMDFRRKQFFEPAWSIEFFNCAIAQHELLFK